MHNLDRPKGCAGEAKSDSPYTLHGNTVSTKHFENKMQTREENDLHSTMGKEKTEKVQKEELSEEKVLHSSSVLPLQKTSSFAALYASVLLLNYGFFSNHLQLQNLIACMKYTNEPF